MRSELVSTLLEDNRPLRRPSLLLSGIRVVALLSIVALILARVYRTLTPIWSWPVEKHGRRGLSFAELPASSLVVDGELVAENGFSDLTLSERTLRVCEILSGRQTAVLPGSSVQVHAQSSRTSSHSPDAVNTQRQGAYPAVGKEYVWVLHGPEASGGYAVIAAFRGATAAGSPAACSQ